MRKPFTKPELQVLIESVNSGKSIRKSAPTIAKNLNRSTLSVEHKMYILKRQLGLAPDRKKRTVKQIKPAEVLSTVQKPEFTLNFSPKRTEVHQDHIRLYF